MKNVKHTVDSLSLVVEEQAEIIKELRNDLKAMTDFHQQRLGKIEDTLDGVNTLEGANIEPF